LNFIISNIKIYIDNKGLTYKDFGTIIGKKSSVVGSYLRGEAQISIESLIKFADEIDETLDYIVFKDWKKNYGKETNNSAAPENIVREAAPHYRTKNKTQEPIDFNKILQSLQHIGELHKKLERIAEETQKIHEKLDLAYLAQQTNKSTGAIEGDKKQD